MNVDMKILTKIMEKVNYETDWEVYAPNSAWYVIAISHRWYSKRRYFRTYKSFMRWADEELGHDGK